MGGKGRMRRETAPTGTHQGRTQRRREQKGEHACEDKDLLDAAERVWRLAVLVHSSLPVTVVCLTVKN
jgi:hypothetical protein